MTIQNNFPKSPKQLEVDVRRRAKSDGISKIKAGNLIAHEYGFANYQSLKSNVQGMHRAHCRLQNTRWLIDALLKFNGDPDNPMLDEVSRFVHSESITKADGAVIEEAVGLYAGALSEWHSDGELFDCFYAMLYECHHPELTRIGTRGDLITYRAETLVLSDNAKPLKLGKPTVPWACFDDTVIIDPDVVLRYGDAAVLVIGDEFEYEPILGIYLNEGRMLIMDDNDDGSAVGFAIIYLEQMEVDHGVLCRMYSATRLHREPVEVSEYEAMFGFSGLDPIFEIYDLYAEKPRDARVLTKTFRDKVKQEGDLP